MAIDIPGLDAEKGLSLYGGEMDIYLEILRSYILNMPKNLDKIRNVSEETLQGYFIAMHGIKGISANIGAERISEAALELEAMARADDLCGVLAKNNDFIAEMEKLLSGIRTWLEQ